MKTAKAISRGFETKFPFSYLNNMYSGKQKVCKATSVADFTNPDIIQDALSQKASFQVRQTMETLGKNGQEKTTVLHNERFAMEIQMMTKSHFMLLAFVFFKKHIEETIFEDPKIKTHLRNMLAVFGLEQLHLDSTPLFESGYFKQGHFQQVVEALKIKIQEVRP